jgi:hypothetical protein
LYRSYAHHSDRRGEAPLEREALLGRYRSSGEPVTFTCVPPGDGVRSALDRNLDGVLDGDELLAGSDPADQEGAPAPSLLGRVLR